VKKTIATVIAAFSLYATAYAAEGKVIPRDDLPAAIKTTPKSAASAKFPGVPACRKGRLETTTSDEIVKTYLSDHPAHKCAEASTVYVCAAFGNLSIRCE